MTPHANREAGSSSSDVSDSPESSGVLDRRSFHLGMINCFAEMVAVGMKRLAISPPLTPEEYEGLREASEAIVEGSGIRSHLETSLLVTHLQSAEFTRGKYSVLYFKDQATLDAYLALKERSGVAESEEERAEISRAFMRLLSYPEEIIEEKIGGGGQEDPFVLGGDDGSSKESPAP